MRLRLPLGAAALVILMGVVVVRAQQDAVRKRSGEELVQRLLDGKSRSQAFYELWRLNNPGKDEGFDAFEEGHIDPSVVVCPQGDGKLPIYVVLYRPYKREMMMPGGGYVIERPGELFPSAPGSPHRQPLDRPWIEVFTAAGRRIDLFEGNDVLDGQLADINGDGFVDRVEVSNHGMAGADDVQVLQVAAVKTPPQPIFTVLMNWGADEWTFRLADQDGDGISDIEAGPRAVDGFKPKTVWKWDKAKLKYVGPEGAQGDHFRVIDGTNIQRELQRLKTAKLAFPRDPETVRKEDRLAGFDAPSRTLRRGGPLVYTSLKGASDVAIFRFMARGKSEFDREREALIQNRLPETFWAMDAKQAALALINANRTDAHRAHFQMAIDDRDKAEPPARCTIAFSDSSSRCYNAVDANYFLHVDPQDSYLAYARSWAGGAVFYSAVHDQPAYDVRLCALRYEDARKIADVIWWLDRARSLNTGGDDESGISSSTADGSGKLTMRAEGKVAVERADTLWSANLSERWEGDYNPEAFLNFAAYLMADALPARLGHEWAQFEPKHPQEILARGNSAPAYNEEERKRLQELGERFLTWYTPEQGRISFSIVAEAARLAGGLVIESAAERLRLIESALPPPGPVKRSSEDVFADLERVRSSFFEEKDRKKRKELEQREAALEKELDAIIRDAGSDSADHLRGAIDLARRQVAAGNDAAQLHTWAVLKSEGHQWAFQRLASVDRKLYADALESQMNQTDGKWARQFFLELAKADPARAAAIARALPPEKKDALALAAFSLLNEAGDVPDETKRLATIIEILHDPKRGWEERRNAITMLVPVGEPLRFPGREVDEALLKLFEPGQADDTINFSLSSACRALALRGRTDLFDRIAQQLQATKDGHVYHEILGALTHLAQSDPKRFKPQLLAVLKPQLTHTGQHLTEIFWAIWAADLRELQPDLERLATLSPDEYEDGRAHSYGKPSPVTGRFHFARKIVSTWAESDALTRARLLAAFAATEDYEFVNEPKPERLARMKTEMERAGAELSIDEKRELAAFLEAIGSAAVPRDGERFNPETRRKVTALARGAFRL